MAAHLTIELNEETLALVVKELNLSNPPNFVLNHSGHFDFRKQKKHEEIRGTYHGATNTITITSQGESYEREGLYVLTKHIRFTVLHELRHRWQDEHWSEEEKRLGRLGDYRYRKEELDANAWADYASNNYKSLVQIKRRTVGNRKRLPG